MKTMEELRDLKDKFKRGEITEEDLDEETQEELLELYKEDISRLREDIMVLREENRMYEEKIEDIKKNIKK